MARNRHRIRIATYNIHKARGMDGRVRPQRIVEVLREIDADIIALQEVVNLRGSRREDHQAEYITEELAQYQYCFGETRKHRGGEYGNAILTRYRLRANCHYDITRVGRESRGVLRADIPLEGPQVLHIFNVHLGTGFFERRYQASRLLSEEILKNPDLHGPRVVIGDFNEWTRGLVTRTLGEHMQSVDLSLFTPRSKTYPGILPVLHLDHMYYDQKMELENFIIHRTRRAVMASDHLPLVADFYLPEETEG